MCLGVDDRSARWRAASCAIHRAAAAGILDTSCFPSMVSEVFMLAASSRRAQKTKSRRKLSGVHWETAALLKTCCRLLPFTCCNGEMGGGQVLCSWLAWV